MVPIEQEAANEGEAIGRAVDTLDEYANSQVAPDFAVGDTVRVDSIDAPECDGVKIKLGELIGKTVYIVSIRDFGGENYRVSLTQGEFGPGAWVKESDITLIAKGQA
jgi:hypothetical protein